MIGKTLSHYFIIEKLGEGGMGVVYKAQDTKLKRTVALKFLPHHMTRDTAAVNRFINEARAASALDHANICIIHEIEETEDGRLFIVLSYYEGETLKHKLKEAVLPVDQAIDIAIQIATGLEKAHGQGIVHRDIKPANIILTNEKIVKILDFGLAKIVDGSIKKSNGSLGTLAYMSPEQIRDEAADERTDMWSLGVVLYEMLAGQLPFKGEYEQAVAYLIVNGEPDNLSNFRDGIPWRLQAIIQKALQKSPEERYQSMAEIIQELSNLKKEASKNGLNPRKDSVPSIAILPFLDMSQQQDQEFFSDGLAEDIISTLCQLKDLRVVARTSSFSFKGKPQDTREIGRRLNVQHLLEGSVQKAGNRLRITAQLINTNEGYHLWSERFDREIDDLFSIQDEITKKIVDKLKVHLLGEEKVGGVKRHTEDMEAYELYLKGRYFWNRRYEGGVQKALQFLNRAIEKDPAYALAYSGISDSFAVMGFYTFLKPRDAFPKAKAAVQQALEIDNQLAEAYASKAAVTWLWDRRYSEADEDFNRAIELKPGYSTAHWWYAVYLAAMGRAKESLETFKKALYLDPLSLIAYTGAGYVCYLTREFDQGIDNCMDALEMDPGYGMAHYFLGRIYEQKQRYDESIAAFDKARASLGVNSLTMLAARPYAVAGKTDEARRLLAEAMDISRHRYVSSYHMAAIHLALNEQKQTLAYLERAFEERDPWLVFLKVDTVFDDLRDDPKFCTLLEKMGLEK